jgi:hypothetical protein
MATSFVVWSFVPGVNGATYIDGTHGVDLGALMGDLARRIRCVEAPLAVDGAWHDPISLARSALERATADHGSTGSSGCT